MDKQISVEQQKGNQGEGIVAAWLEGRCYPRRNLQGQDIGIDLYCETHGLTDEGRRIPWLHVWLQVRTTSRTFKPYTRVDCGELRYWARQPVPVIVIKVGLPPESHSTDQQPKIALFNLADWLLSNEIPATGSVRLQADEVFEPTADTADRLINEIVPEATVAWNVRQGIVRPIPSPSPSYVIEYKEGLTTKRQWLLLQTIRANLRMMCVDQLKALKEGDSAALQLVRDFLPIYRNVVLCLEDSQANKKALDRVTLGDLHMGLGEPKEALAHYEVAEGYIKGDERLWERHKEQGEEWLRGCRGKIESAKTALEGQPSEWPVVGPIDSTAIAATTSSPIPELFTSIEDLENSS